MRPTHSLKKLEKNPFFLYKAIIDKKYKKGYKQSMAQPLESNRFYPRPGTEEFEGLKTLEVRRAERMSILLQHLRNINAPDDDVITINVQDSKGPVTDSVNITYKGLRALAAIQHTKLIAVGFTPEQATHLLDTPPEAENPAKHMVFTL